MPISLRTMLSQKSTAVSIKEYISGYSNSAIRRVWTYPRLRSLSYSYLLAGQFEAVHRIIRQTGQALRVIVWPFQMIYPHCMSYSSVQTKEETITRLIEHCRARDDIRLLILHGSAAQDRLRADSDIDIALALHRPLSIDEKLDYILTFSRLCGREIDLSDLRTIGGLFLHRVLSKGILIINRDIELYNTLVQNSLIYIEDIHPIVQHAQTLRIKEFVSERNREVFQHPSGHPSASTQSASSLHCEKEKSAPAYRLPRRAARMPSRFGPSMS